MNQSESPQLDRPLIPGARAPLSATQALRIVAARRWLIAGTVVLFAVLAVLAYLLLPRSYVAQVSLLIEFPGTDPATGQSYPSDLAASYQATQVDLLDSQKVRLATVHALHLTADAKARKAFKASAPPGASFAVWLAERMGKNIRVDTDPSSHIIGVAYQGADPKRAAKTVNALVGQYIQASTQMVTAPAQHRAARYAKFLAGLRAKVDTAQQKLTSARQKLGVIDLNDAGRVGTQRLEDLGIKLNQAQADYQAARAQVQQIRVLRRAGKPVTAQAEILNSNFVQQLKGRLLALQSQRADLKQTMGRNHPRIRALNDQIATVSHRLRHEIDAYLQSNRNQADTAGDRVAALQKSIEQARANVMAAQHKRDTIDKDVRELASAKKVYEGALNQYDQILGNTKLPHHNVSVVSWAEPPQSPTGMSGRKKLLFALILGSLVGGALALLLELIDRRIRDPEDIRREMGLPVLGELPA